MKIRPSLLIIIIVLIVLIVAAIILGKSKEPVTPESGQEQGEIAEEILGVSGTIEDIGQNSLILNALILLQDPSKEPIRKSIKVSINDETRIYKLAFPNPESMTQEQIENGVEPIETTIGLSDLKKGDTIDIRSEENISENIKNKTEVTAKNIFIIEK